MLTPNLPILESQVDQLSDVVAGEYDHWVDRDD